MSSIQKETTFNSFFNNYRSDIKTFRIIIKKLVYCLQNKRLISTPCNIGKIKRTFQVIFFVFLNGKMFQGTYFQCITLVTSQDTAYFGTESGDLVKVRKQEINFLDILDL